MMQYIRKYFAVLAAWDSGRSTAVVFLLLLLVFRYADPAALQLVRVKTFDFYQTLSPRIVTDRPVVIIDIDEESLAELGQWPWPRKVLAKMVHRLHNMGAKVIGFDVFFVEPDRVSPNQLAKTLPNLDPVILRTLHQQPDNDELFARAIAKANVVMGQSVNSEESKIALKRLEKVKTIPFVGGDPRRHMPDYASIITNIDILNEAAAGHGAVALLPETDGIVRRVPLVIQVNKRLIPALTTEMLRLYFDNSSTFVRANSELGVERIIVRPKRIETDSSGRYWVYYSKHDPGKYISARDLLNGKIPDEAIKGKLVLVGTSAAGILDIRSTPLDPRIPGVEVHAQVLENVLQDTQLSRPQSAVLIEMILTFMIGLALIILIPKLGAKWTLFLTVLGVAGMFEGSWFMFSNERELYDPIYPALVVVLLFMYMTYRTFAREEKQRREMRQAFSHYLSPELVGRLAANPSSVNLGGEMRDLTILFSDIRRFTTISENYGAEELTHLINTYLTPMSDIILRRAGTIDKYMGDCIMAFWNAPLDVEDHAVQACKASAEMIEALAVFNSKMQAEAIEKGQDFAEIKIGIGINTGNACVGNIGSEQRFSYSVLGDAVNIASRLEELTKTYPIITIAGEPTKLAAPNFAWLEVDLIKVRGRSRAQKIYTLIGSQEVAANEDFKKLAKAHTLMLTKYRAMDFAAAAGYLTECRNNPMAEPVQELYDLYQTRLDEYRQSPPPEDWDGVYQAPAQKEMNAA